MRTFEKWQCELDCEHHVCKNELDHSLVVTLWCNVSTKNEDRMWG